MTLPASPGPALPVPVLDALRLPLQGSRLIEASAGTGKTWTIAALYLRLVLGHGAPGEAPPRALAPAEILVMTFTRAATRELSERIRARLIEAARCFRGEAQPAPQDRFLQALIEAHPDGQPEAPGEPGPALTRRAAAHRLALAAEAMDDAAVHTIDAWCQRMLREHAFDSGQLFEEELVADEAELLQQAVHDHWRREVYPLAGPALEAVLACWPSVDVLAGQVRPLLGRAELLGEFAGRGQSLAQWTGQQLAELAALKTGWVQGAAELRAWLDAQCRAKVFNGSKLRADYHGKWCDALADWAQGPQEQPDLKTGRSRLTEAGLADALAKNQSLPALPPVVEALHALLRTLDERAGLAEALLRHAVHGVAQRLERLKRQGARFGFADLQARLAQALDGPQGERLRARIVAQYPAVLVDEFQDTSPLQYRLFDRLYDVAANRPASVLLLIGDPKQSIYGFRGADIYSYLAARGATAGRQYMLDTNYRSTEALVEAVNRVFTQAEDGWEAGLPGGEPPPVGAFALPQRGPWALPFEPVRAQGRRERLVASVAGAVPAELAALHLQWLPTPLPAEALRRLQARQAAAQIVALLGDPQAGFVTPGEAGAPEAFRRLTPGDIAVLVRSRREADALRRALRRVGVNSVYLSDQDSVFASPEAADLLRWLQAVADPLDAPRVRAAFATPTLGLDWAQLQALRDDEDAWEQRLALLQRLRATWQRQGVLAMLQQSLHELELPSKWLSPPRCGPAAPPQGGATSGPAQPDPRWPLAEQVSRGEAEGERRLTNWLHLGELLQAAAAQVDGEHALIRWLAEAIQGGPGASGDERVLRLESDAALVQVVTVHKSKGLEYPLVFLPFAQSAHPLTRRARQAVEVVDEAGRRRLDFHLGDEALAAADAERLREELRLFYVALTRARHAIWLGIGLPAVARPAKNGPTHDLHRGALGHLLCAGRPLPAEEVGLRLQRWADADPGTRFERLDAPPSGRRWQRPPPEAGLIELRPYRADFERDWGVGSFSQLVRDLDEARLLAALSESSPGDALREERLREELLAVLPVADTGEAETPPLATAAGWHAFPKGALAGNFLHDQLEWLAQEGEALGQEALGGDAAEEAGEAGAACFADPRDEAVQAALRRRCERGGHGERADAVIDWLARLLHTPLPPLAAPLGALRLLRPELEFWMPSVGLRSQALDAACLAHLLPGRPRPVLPPRQLQGLLMGFADLVFEHGGRYWVLDYKSNALGADESAYHPAALEQAMLAHRYELQAGLYLLALHRLLRARLGSAYDPARQLGGAIYLFLRGIAAPGAGCVHLPATPALLDALDACLAGEGEAAVEGTPA
ncbi:UvrD-helicase domain-containing protein [Sphaerotilus microaerophilus]|nr:UvrD-helicase domain-containing protein [Sphaerotilus sp. FB-5]